MTNNARPVPSQSHQVAWIWPTIGTVLPDGLPQGAFTLIRVSTHLLTGFAVLDDLVSSVVQGGQRVTLIPGAPRLVGPRFGAISATVRLDIRTMPLRYRGPVAPGWRGSITPQYVGRSIASRLARQARRNSEAPTVGLWWHEPTDGADSYATLNALLNVAHVVIDVIGSDDNGPLLTLSSRASLQDPLPFQRPVPRAG